jgi:ABC-2 type transport system ATP-binding protein
MTTTEREVRTMTDTMIRPAEDRPARPARAAVRLQGLSKSFGAVRAVDGIDLDLEQGRTVAVLGRNGAGKSTMLSMLLGLLPPDQGRVTVFGRSPQDAIRAGLVGAMPQDGGLIPRVTVRELISFVAGTYPRPLPLAEILAVTDLTALAGRRADKLSGGQAQRVRFALAVAGDPDLIVLDEPTAALDVDSRRQLWAVIRGWAAQGKTVLFSTHHLDEADRYADRIVIVAHGRIAADGTGPALKRRAATTDLETAFVTLAGPR